MVGCGLIWGACAIATIAFIKHRRFHGRHWGYGPGGGCHGGRGGGGGRGFRRFGLRYFIRGLFERLETTPGQEKAIVKAVEELQEALMHARSELKGSRKDLAEAFRRGPIDEASVSDIFVKHDSVISETRRKAVEALGQIHEALDDRQRAEVADLLENGPGYGGHWRRGPGYGW